MFWKRKKNRTEEYKCSDCGQVHSDWSTLAFKSPANYDFLSGQEKSDTNFSEIKYEDQIDRFIRVTLTQKINDAFETLDYGLWVSLSEKSYSDYKENFYNLKHETQYFGWLCSNINEYGDTFASLVILKNGQK